LFGRDFHPVRSAKLRLAHQRFALAAGGRAWIRFESRKSPKPEKMLENGAESHQSAARFVGTLFAIKVLCL